MATSLNPRTTTYEFFGPAGTLAITILVPLTTYVLYFGCSEQAGGCPPDLTTLLPPDLLTRLLSLAWWLRLWDAQATAIYFAWYAFCVAAWYILPGDWVEGAKMRNGQTKKYKINGSYIVVAFSRIHVQQPASQHSQPFSSLWVSLPALSLDTVPNLSLSCMKSGLVL
jgi:Ergosterol biosynthesis ERG4/ERG24 family